MTDNTRLAAMQAVVEAAREQARFYTASSRTLAALDALDALPEVPAPAEVVVTLAVWEDMSCGVVALVVPGSDCDDPEPNCRRLGTVTLEVTP